MEWAVQESSLKLGLHFGHDEQSLRAYVHVPKEYGLDVFDSHDTSSSKACLCYHGTPEGSADYEASVDPRLDDPMHDRMIVSIMALTLAGGFSY